MKTEKGNENDNTSQTIWENSNVHLPHLTEECLPVIGHSQISSILSTLDPSEKLNPINMEIPPNLELIVIQNPPTEPPQTENKLISNNLKAFVCHLCPFFCLNEKRMTEHVKLEHKTKKPTELFELKCPACTNIFYNKFSLQTHLTYDHFITDNEDVEKILQVTLCSKVGFNKSKSIEIDIAKTPIIIEGLSETIPSLLKKEEDNRIRMIRICAENNAENLVDDVVEASQEESVVHSLPEETELETSPKSKIEKNLKLNLTKLLSAKLNKCNILNCKVNLKCPDKLSYHKKCHKEKIFNCPECNQTFSCWKYMTGHLWRAHKIDMELFHCDKCDYRTYSLANLNNIHKLIHETAKTFECDVCKKCFKNVKQLRNHKDTHKKYQKGDGSCFKCSECNKSFTNRHQMKIHIDGIHRKLKPFLCSYCGYKSATRGALRIHIRQHTGEKPFRCNICSYSTADHNSLRRHKLRHSGDKPYKCNHCDYQCIQSSTYKVHVKTKHPGLDKELLFSCAHCQFRSISKEVYNSHLISQHPEMKLA